MCMCTVLLLTVVQVLYLLEVFILAHYDPPSTETPTTETTTAWCHKNSWIYLTCTYYWWLLRPTITIRFHSIRNEKKHYSHSTNLLSLAVSCSPTVAIAMRDSCWNALTCRLGPPAGPSCNACFRLTLYRTLTTDFLQVRENWKKLGNFSGQGKVREKYFFWKSEEKWKIGATRCQIFSLKCIKFDLTCDNNIIVRLWFVRDIWCCTNVFWLID